jgi:hypothetical protein
MHFDSINKDNDTKNLKFRSSGVEPPSDYGYRREDLQVVPVDTIQKPLHAWKVVSARTTTT